MYVMILLFFAFVFAALAAFNINTSKISFGWLALALYLLSLVIEEFLKK